MPKKIKTSASANAHYENEEHRVYAFHNIMCNFILYINDNDGYTRLEDGTKIKSVANRGLYFDASRKHNSTTCTDAAARFNINFNYIGAPEDKKNKKGVK